MQKRLDTVTSKRPQEPFRISDAIGGAAPNRPTLRAAAVNSFLTPFMVPSVNIALPVTARHLMPAGSWADWHGPIRECAA